MMGNVLGTRRTQIALMLALLVASSWALYFKSVSFSFVLDDYVQVSENPAVVQGLPIGRFFLDRATTSTRADYNTRIYRPFRNLAFRGLAATFGVTPAVFHVANLVLYGIAICLVFQLALAVLPSERGALIAAAFFLLLPVHVEPVVYVSALGDLLSLDLELLGLIFGLRACHDYRRRWATGGAAVICLTLAMTAKEMAITGPGLLLLLLVHRRPPTLRPALILAGSLTLVSAGYLALRTHVVGSMGQEPIGVGSVLRGLQEAPALLLGYLQIALMPFGHRPSYVVPTPSPVLACVLVAAFTVSLWALRQADLRRNPRGGLAVWWAWFMCALLPVLHIVPLWADLADRFVLVSSVAVALAAGDLGEWVLHVAPRRAVALVAGAVAVVYAAGTWVEQDVWRNDYVLWRYAAAAEPGSGLAQSNWCLAALKKGEHDLAMAACDRADHLGYRQVETQARRAVILQALGRNEEAGLAAHRSLAADPGQVQMYALLGDLALSRGDVNAAQQQLDEAHRRDANHPSTFLLQAALAQRQNRLPEALAIYERLTARAPGVPRFHFLAAAVANKLNERVAEERHCQACLSEDPLFRPCVDLCAVKR